MSEPRICTCPPQYIGMNTVHEAGCPAVRQPASEPASDVDALVATVRNVLPRPGSPQVHVVALTEEWGDANAALDALAALAAARGDTP